jgi:hypothetical protein
VKILPFLILMLIEIFWVIVRIFGILNFEVIFSTSTRDLKEKNTANTNLKLVLLYSPIGLEYQ